MKIKSLMFSTFALFVGMSAGIATAEPYCQSCPYSCDDLGLGRKDCSPISSSRGMCCVDLSGRGLDLAHAQDHALQDGARPQPAAAERCPSGFSPSEQKCSVEERRRGCKDMRLPGGLGCELWERKGTSFRT